MDKSVAAPRPGKFASRRLLIVDDDVDSAESMRYICRHAGHDVRIVHEGEAVLEAAAEFGAEAILLDIGLPDIDGHEVARRLRADPRTRDVLIIAITGHARDEDRQRSREVGIDEHVEKPVAPDEVLERIARGRAPQSRNSGASAQSDVPTREDNHR